MHSDRLLALDDVCVVAAAAVLLLLLLLDDDDVFLHRPLVERCGSSSSLPRGAVSKHVLW
jgi:hypothetical protein